MQTPTPKPMPSRPTPGALPRTLALLVWLLGLATGTVGLHSRGEAADRAAGAGAAWVLVVNPTNPVRELPREEVERIYRRNRRYWDNDTTVLPINLPPRDPVREAFSAEVLHADDAAMALFWNRKYFQGILPPAVLRSAQAVRAYVAATPGAVGYLPSTMVDASVAVVEIRNGR